MSSVYGTSPHENSDYIGDATIVVRGAEIEAHIELRGYREPIDGIFRWIGRVSSNDRLTDVLGDAPRTKVTVRTRHSARQAFIGDRDPWNRYRITGKSTPPFHVATELSDIFDDEPESTSNDQRPLSAP